MTLRPRSESAVKNAIAAAMTRQWAVAFLACLVAMILMVTGCKSAPAVSVQLMPNSSQNLEAGKTLPISATLSNDSGQQGVRWTLNGQGTLVAQTATSVMYQAPPNVSGTARVTVTATSNADGRGSASLTIVLETPPNRTGSDQKNSPIQGAR
jgi:hypothetical protein